MAPTVPPGSGIGVPVGRNYAASGGCITPGCMAPYGVRNVSAKSEIVQARPGTLLESSRLLPRDLAETPVEMLEALASRPIQLHSVVNRASCGPILCGAEGVEVTLEARFGSAEEAVKVARRHRQEDNPSQAYSVYALALELEEDNPQLCDEFAQFLHAHGQLDGAEYLFNRALALDPLNVEYSYRRGVVLQQRRRLADAAEAFQHVIRMEPRFVAAHFNLGTVRRELGDFPNAAESFRRILQIEPENHSAMAMLSECLADMGDIPAAKRWLEQCLLLDPSNRAFRKDLDRLHHLETCRMAAWPTAAVA